MQKSKFVSIGIYDAGSNNSYNIYVNEEIVKLINKVIEETSYKIEGDYKLTNYEEVIEAIKTINIYLKHFKIDIFHSFKFAIHIDEIIKEGFPFPRIYENQSSMYRDITDIDVIQERSRMVIYFHGKKLIYPELGKIIYNLFGWDDTNKKIDRFIEYEDHEEMIPIDRKIELLNKQMEDYNSFDTERKKQILRQLLELYEAKDNGNYFNAELLRKYYNSASEMIELREFNEKGQESEEGITLKNYSKVKVKK